MNLNKVKKKEKKKENESIPMLYTSSLCPKKEVLGVKCCSPEEANCSLLQ